MLRQNRHSVSSILIVALSAALLLPACGTFTKQTQATLSEAESAVQSAKAADAAELAPTTFDAANTQLASAKKALSQKQLSEARRSAEKATTNAQLATLEAERTGYDTISLELQQEIDAINNRIGEAKERLAREIP